ncbi:MAG: ECF transporter S component [Ruminococcaceae bacterium]|nr:ECF transporter S component [Oscillospiraceae bacterium]
MKIKENLQTMIFSALFLALALVLPFLGGQMPEINSVFCPMHIPIFLCGFICGWKWGLTVGFVAPILRSLIFGFPVIYPIAISMAFELAAYGLITGFSKTFLPKKKPFIYCSLITSMIIGRIFRAVATFILTVLSGNTFVLSVFINGVILTSIPGMIAHIIIVPIAVILIEKLILRHKAKETA